MTRSLSDETKTIVNTLLEVGDCVLEISRDHVITGIWYSMYAAGVSFDHFLGRKVTDTPYEAIVVQCDSRIAEGFKNRRNSYNEYTVEEKQVSVTYSARVLPIHPDKEYLFVVIENLSNKDGFELEEDKWKLALDAAGDGVWDYNPQTGEITFSEKWQELFGYKSDNINTAAAWSAKIHPEDVGLSQNAMTDCINGITDSYQIEIRYRSVDNAYKWILSRGVIIGRDEDGKALRLIGTHTDINERKIADEQHLATANLLSKLIDNLHTGILVTDETDTALFANQMFCDLYSINSGPDELIGIDMRKGISKRKTFFTDEERFGKRTKEIFDRKELVLNEEWELKDGRIVSRDYIPMYLNENTYRGILQMKDITVQKNAGKQLEEQRLFYERVLHHIPADIAVFDPDHKYLFVNAHAFKNEELRKWMIGKTDIDYAKYSNRPESFVKERFAMQDRAFQQRQSVEWIEKLIAKDGKTEHHLRILRPIFYENGEPELILAYGLNITDLINAQEALKTSVETFSSAFEHSGVGMALISPFGHWLDMNNPIIELTGYTKEELQRLTFQDITYHEDKDKDAELVKQMLKKEITTYTIEKRCIAKTKKIIWVSLTLSMVWDSDSTPKFFIAQILDISQKKELEQAISQRNGELEATKTSLINKVKQLEELSYIIAHNLRGAAGNIKAISGAIVAKNKGGKFAEENPLSGAFTQEEAMSFIEESSNSLMSSLSTLMQITEIKLNNRIPYNVCDITAIINEITGQLNSVIYEKNAVIKTDIQFQQVSYPKAYLENILYNLISNALKYTRPDVNPEILITSRMWNGKTQIIVKDNGLGINLQKYGNLVFKLNNVFHKGFDSKGVGLYITKNQVESLGGTIELFSEVNDGCEFVVTL